EALRSLRATVSTTVAATLTVLIGMFVLGLSIAFGTWLLSWSDHLKQELVVKAFYRPHVPIAQVVSLKRQLQANPLVKNVVATSPAEGWAKVKADYPAVTKVGVFDNPIGWALTAYPK